MDSINKLNKHLFIIALLIFAIVGLVVVVLQIIGLCTVNGDLMVFASKKVYKIAILGSTIAGFLSFIYPYTKSKEKNK